MILKNALFQQRVLKKGFHIIILCIWAAMMIYYIANDELGMSFEGTCSLISGK